MTARTLLLHVSLSLFAAALLLLFVGLTLYCLMMKRRRARKIYNELLDPPPAVPSCTAPIVLVSQGAWATPGEIPFTLPPPFSPVTDVKLSEETEDQSQTQETHRGSLSVSSWFPVGSILSGLYPPQSATAPPAALWPQLCFSLQYRPDSEQLLVSLLRLSNLPQPLHSRLALVELRLLPDDRRPLQAKARNTGREPEFNDCVVFQVSPWTVRSSVLVLQVFSVGADGGRCSVGGLEVTLRGDLCNTGRVQWRALQTPQKQSSALELLVSLCYSVTNQRLSVGVGGVNGLRRETDTDVQVQVSLQSPSSLKSKQGPAPKTESRPGPVQSEEDLNQKYSFKLKQSQLEQSCVRIEVQQSHRETDGLVSVLVLGPLLFSRGSQMDHWMEMLSVPGQTVERWHSLGPTI